MSTKIGSVVIDIDAKLTSLEANLAKATKRFDKFDKDMRRTGGHLEASFAKLGTAMTTMVAAFASTALAGGIAGLANTAKQIQNLSRLSGLGAVEFQSFAFAAKSVGFESDKVADILKDVNDKFGDFFQTGAGPLADFFEQIAPKVGVTAEQFRKLSSKDALQLYVNSLEKANVSQAEMTFYLEAVANDATALIPILKNGGAQLSAMEQEFRDLGLAIDDTTAKRLVEAQRSWDRGLTIMQNRATIFAGGVIEVLERVGEAMDRNRANFVLSNSNASEKAQQWAQDILIAQNRAGMDRLSALSRTFAPGDYLAEDDPWEPQDPKGGGGAKAKPGKPTFSPADLRLGNDLPPVELPISLDVDKPLVDLDKMNVGLEGLRQRVTAADIALADTFDFELFDRVQQIGDAFEQDIARSLADVLVYSDNLGDSLESAFKRMASAMLEAVIQAKVLGPLLESIGVSGGGGGAFTSIFGGFFADGGRPPMGKVSVVGERGPELFVPDMAGTIIPNHAISNLGGGSRVEVVPSPYFDVRVQEISGQTVAAAAPAMINASVAGTMRLARRPRLPGGLG